MTKAQIKSIHEEINAAVFAVLAKNGLAPNGSNISYCDSDFTYKLKVNVMDSITGKKVVSSNMINDALRMLYRNGNVVDRQKMVEAFSKTYSTTSIGDIQLIDVDTKKYRYPFIVKSSLGGQYKLSASQFLKYSKLDK